MCHEFISPNLKKEKNTHSKLWLKIYSSLGQEINCSLHVGIGCQSGMGAFKVLAMVQNGLKD